MPASKQVMDHSPPARPVTANLNAYHFFVGSNRTRAIFITVQNVKAFKGL